MLFSYALIFPVRFDPVNTVQEIHGISLAGGSAFRLDAASDVVRYLEEKERGFPVGELRIPIVPAAILSLKLLAISY